MTQVAQSSSGGSSVASEAKPMVFDIADEHDTLLLLRTIHRSGIKQRVRNELRDLLFSVRADDAKSVKMALRALTNEGFEAVYGDVSLPAGESKTADKAESKARTASTQSVGRSRRAPEFTFTPASVSAKPTATKPPSKPTTKPTPVDVVEESKTAPAPPVQSESKLGPKPVSVAPKSQPIPVKNVNADSGAKAAPPTTEPPETVPIKSETNQTSLAVEDKPAAAAPTPPAATTVSQQTTVDSASPVPPATPPPAAPISADSTAESNPPDTTEAAYDGDPMERIKEIKRLVNEKVGNPIALIDADNQVGREYMNALLAAMKVINGGTPAEVVAAMERLEKAQVAAINVALKAPPPETTTDRFVSAAQASKSPTTPASTANQPAPAAATPSPTPPVVSAPAATTPPAAPTPVPDASGQATSQPIPPASSVGVTPKSVSSPVPATAPASANPSTGGISGMASLKQAVTTKSISGEEIQDEQATVPTTPTAGVTSTPSAAPAPSYTPPMSSGATTTSAPTPAAPTAATPAAVADTPATAGTKQDTRLMSVAKEEQIQKLMKQKEAEEAKKKGEVKPEPVNGDSLQAPAVTTGLKQLLSEWGLFKSSGFFGTGPGGMDHPLYQQMAPLTMAAVIAGRFEGATPQIKQSITDYMNGWRYEEGIVHEHGETFETYLRRVIRHILDNKDKQAPVAEPKSK